jgi:hypothetical protein
MFNSEVKGSDGAAQGQGGDGYPAVGKYFQYLVQAVAAGAQEVIVRNEDVAKA